MGASAEQSYQNSTSVKLAHFAQRICIRIQRHCQNHWDINSAAQIVADIKHALQLPKLEAQHAAISPLTKIQAVLEECIQTPELPDAELNQQLIQLAQQIVSIEPDLELTKYTQAHVELPIATSIRCETPPNHYWRRWAQDIDAPLRTKKTKKTTSPSLNGAPPPRTAEMSKKTNASKAPIEPTAMVYRIYHLCDYSDLSTALAQSFEKAGMTLETLSDEKELQELLEALPADLVIIDAGFAENITSISNTLASYRNANGKHLYTVQIINTSSDIASQHDLFKCMDAVMSNNTDVSDIITRIDHLLRFGKTEQYRVLIVEDDRSQAMFAEGILRNAEISTKVLLVADNLLDEIESFKPDLILMDLHMPNSNGIELTELIRESKQHQNIPIVFLSGEADEDRQHDALEAGGDDFLIKPIRPRRLISAVQNRIKRHRTLLSANTRSSAGLSPGLMQRMEMLELIRSNIKKTDNALLFIEINGFNLLKDRLGLTHLDLVLKDFSSILLQIGSPHSIARFGDGSFVLIYNGDCSDNVLSSYASGIRQKLMDKTFEALSQSIQFRVHIGICHFEYGQNSADYLINSGERTARQARSNNSGIALYKPQSSSEQVKEQAICALLENIQSNNCLSHIYQPIVAVAGGIEKQFQTLLRLTDESGQVIAAAEFIPIAERTNLIVSLDRWSMTKAVSIITEKQLVGEDIKLFVNQSSATLLENEQATWLKNMLKAYNVPSQSIVIEINHNDALLNHQAIIEFCQSVQDYGIQFCLSRFNPNNDEVNVLENLPINYLKLAHKLSSELSNPSVRNTVNELVRNAHLRGIEVIGHSVEDAQTAATLWMSGIDFIQGNLVQSPNVHMDFGFDQSVL